MNTSRMTAPAAGNDLADAAGGLTQGVAETTEDLAALSERRRLARLRALRRLHQSRAFTLIELMIVLEVIMILAGMALPSIKTTRKQACEASAVLTLRQLSDAQELYRPRQMPATYADTFEKLHTAGLIDGTLMAEDGKSYLERSGYRFIVWRNPDQSKYAFMAHADVQGSTGDRSFYVDESGVIRMEPDASVSPASPPL